MELRIAAEATEEEASAIAAALAEHLGEPVEVFAGSDDDPVATATPGGDDGPDAGTAAEGHIDADARTEDAARGDDGDPDAQRADDGDPAAHSAGDVDPDDLGPTEREERLREQLADVYEGGPEKYRDRLDEQGKLFVRDRLELWFGTAEDGRPDLLFEDGTFANFDAWHPDSPAVDEYDPDVRLPADGMVTGAAEFEGREVHFVANDFTVKAGSMAARGVEKFLRVQQRALENGKPVLYLMDSAGGRIDEQTGFFANREGIGKYYYNHSLLSGRVPQICVLYGPCFAGAAYTPVFADFTIMVEGISSMAIASPRMVEMVTGEQVDADELGGPAVHAEHSGSADLVARDEAHARELVAQLLSYLPDCTGERPPRREGTDPARSPAGIDSVIPRDPDKAYDMRDLIERGVDADSWLEIRPDYGPEVLTGFARIDGRPIAVVANQPARRAGAIFPDSAEKAAQFVWTADAYDVPVCYLCDTPGFMAGAQVERDGILEAGKKFIYATAAATVPQQTVVVRKAYGAGIYAMGGPAYGPQSVIALPSGEIGIMGPEAAINAVYARRLDAIEDEAKRASTADDLREQYRRDIDVRRMASDVVIDEVVPPSDLRVELAARFAFYEDVAPDRPEKKHGTVL